MSPPDPPGIPGRRRLPVAEDVVTATAPHTPVPPARERHPSWQHIEVEEADDRPSVVEFGKAVHVQHGKLRIVIPWVVVAALITAVGTYYGAHAAQAATPPNDAVLAELKAFKSEYVAAQQDQKLQNALIIQRVGTLETQNGVTQGQLSAILTNLRSAPR